MNTEKQARLKGWYFVRFENWEGDYDGWCPALWNGTYWQSYRCTEVGDTRTIVGGKTEMPPALVTEMLKPRDDFAVEAANAESTQEIG